MFQTAFQVVYLVTVLFMPGGHVETKTERMPDIQTCYALQHQRGFTEKGRFLTMCVAVEEREA